MSSPVFARPTRLSLACRRRTTAVVAVLALFASAGATSAHAATAPAFAHAAAPGTAVIVEAPVSPDVARTMAAQGLSATEAVEAYWTPERMAAAVPAAIPATAPAGARPPHRSAPAPAQAERVLSPAAPVSPPERPAAARSAGPSSNSPAAPYSAMSSVGKVFFTKNQTDYVCSGSVLNTDSKQVVNSAAHCLYFDGGWVSNWAIAPYYNYGNLGTWAGRHLGIFKVWKEKTSYDYDVGFVKTHDNGGKRIVDVAGGNGMIIDGSRSRAMTIFGYPAAAPYDGEKQHYCDGTTEQFQSMIKMACGLTAGASGGPWFAGYTGGHVGYLNGLTSLGNGTSLLSPYFTGAFARLANAVDKTGT